VLESQLLECKQEYEKNKKLLLEKSSNDDKLIVALKSELEKLKKAKGGDPKIIYSKAVQPEQITDSEAKLVCLVSRSSCR